MTTTSLVGLDDLTNEAFSVLYRHTERPFSTTVGADALTTTTDTNLTLASLDRVGDLDLLEFADGEQARVRGISDSDVVTVERGYNGTLPSASHGTGTKVVVNPTFGYLEVQRWLKRWFTTHGNTFFPYLTTEVFFREPGEQVVVLDQDVIQVMQVRSQALETGRIVDLAHWQFEDNVPTSIYSTGKVLRVSNLLADDDELWVTYTTPYDVTVDPLPVPVGGEDLPVLFAAAYAVGRREVSRLDLDEMGEWNQEAAIRGGQNLRLMRELWGEYYRRLDEARKTYMVPKHRPYKKMPRIR